MLDLMTHLFRLQAIVEEGSMRRAAQRLNITQPALSRSIAHVEDRLGQPLLQRHARGVEPTVYGQEALTLIRRLSRHWELAEQELMASRATTKRVLRLEAGPLWRVVILPRVLGRLKERHPGIRFELTNLRAGESRQRLAEGRIDVLCGGLQSLEEMPSNLCHRAYTHFHDRVVARADHPLFDRVDGSGALPPEALLDYDWLVYTGDPVYELETSHATTERLGREPNVRISCQSLDAAVRVLQNSDCVSILPDGALHDTHRPALARLPVSLGQRRASSGVIYREEMVEWPPLLDLLEECERHFAGIGTAD